jgi:hypothetical protein
VARDILIEERHNKMPKVDDGGNNKKRKNNKKRGKKRDIEL